MFILGYDIEDDHQQVRLFFITISSLGGICCDSRPLVDDSGDFNGSGSLAAVSVTAFSTVNSDEVAAVRVAAVHLAAVMAVGVRHGYYVTSHISYNTYLYFQFLENAIRMVEGRGELARVKLRWGGGGDGWARVERGSVGFGNRLKGVKKLVSSY